MCGCVFAHVHVRWEGGGQVSGCERLRMRVCAGIVRCAVLCTHEEVALN